MDAMQRREFEQLVREGYRRIPKRFRERVKNVAFLVEDEPSPELRAEEGLSEHETLLGHYRGVPYTERGALYGVEPTLPDTVVIFQKPIEEISAGDPERTRRIVADTVWHEIAHHFGFDEDAVRRREDERGVER
jgi:predicted Zn-dependent protease with MMP-like domain